MIKGRKQFCSENQSPSFHISFFASETSTRVTKLIHWQSQNLQVLRNCTLTQLMGMGQGALYVSLKWSQHRNSKKSKTNVFWEMPDRDSEDSCRAHRMFSLKESSVLMGRCCLGKRLAWSCCWQFVLLSKLISGGLAPNIGKTHLDMGDCQIARRDELNLGLPSLRVVKMANSGSLC